MTTLGEDTEKYYLKKMNEIRAINDPELQRKAVEEFSASLKRIEKALRSRLTELTEA